MKRSRVREREHVQALVETGSLAAYAAELRPIVATLRTLADDATAHREQRVHSRALLRRGLMKSLRQIEARIDAAAPPAPEHGDPAGLSAPAT